ncbi:MAG: hypothetical protein AAFR52_11185 [Pseudomonadota bacterium]
MLALMLVALLAPASVAAASPGAGEGQLTPDEFRAYSEGYTLYFERDGEPWGSEWFGPDGAVTWRYPSGTCIEGVWRGYDRNICFYYGPGTEVLCWSMRREEDGLIGELLEGDEAGLELTITHRDRVPLSCGDSSDL